MSIILKFREQLPVVVREELDQLVASLQDLEATVQAGGGSGGGGSGVGPIGPPGPPGPTGPQAALEYLGDYVGGPAYHDGDIVVAADGNAYMCVVDGTTTPPEPWPGGGMTVNATVDASYWVVSAHGALTNARVLSALANGYVKATAGEPSTVAQIPITDGGTGASTTAQARTNLGIGSVGVINLDGNAAHYLDGSGNWSTPPQVSGVQSGSILFFTTPCPAGYTRVSAFDGRFLRMNSAYATGGAASHQHGPGSYAAPAHTHGVGTLVEAAHNHGAGNLGVVAHTHSLPNTDAAGAHAHSFTGRTDVESNGSGIMDAGGNQNCTQAPHTHGFGGNTDTASNHTHSLSQGTGSASPGLTGATQSIAATISGATASTGPLAIAGSSDAQSNLPLYVDLFACQKN
jgi:hypothetical protein